MALYHFSVKVFSRAKGHSAVAAAAYRSGERLHDERNDVMHDYRARGGVERSEIFAPQNAQGWAYEREELWNRAEGAETRKNSQTARLFVLAGQRELTPEQNWHCAQTFVERELVRRGMIADVSMHADEGNPHFHVGVTMRRLNADGSGFAAKKERSWNDKELLETWRKSWADIVNDELELHGHAARVDHQSNADRGLGQPTQHIGKAAWAMMKTGKVEDPVHVRQAREIIAARSSSIDGAWGPLTERSIDDIAAGWQPVEDWPQEEPPPATWVDRIEQERNQDISWDREPDFDLC